MYNIAQVLAGAADGGRRRTRRSLFGKRLWAETRIALFQQAVDTRSPDARTARREARVSFGTRWVEEVGRRDLPARTSRASARSSAPTSTRTRWRVLDRGEIPQLKALRLHNGTIYRWNRACYGITDGKPHLRIENRVMPAGPEHARRGRERRVLVRPDGRARRARATTSPARIDFDQARANFYTAAREGLGAHFTWLDGEDDLGARARARSAAAARRGRALRRQGIDDADIKKYLGVVEERVRTRPHRRALAAVVAGTR